MGRVYTVPFRAIAVSAAQDLFSVQVPADMIIEVLSLKVFQTSDVGDAAEEILGIRVRRQTGAFTVGSGGAAVTPVRAHEGDAASGVTARRNDTTQALATFEDYDHFGWNVRIPQPEVWTPEEQFTIFGTSDLVIDLPVAPADALTMSAVLRFKELG